MLNMNGNYINLLLTYGMKLIIWGLEENGLHLFTIWIGRIGLAFTLLIIFKLRTIATFQFFYYFHSKHVSGRLLIISNLNTKGGYRLRPQPYLLFSS